MIGRRFLAGDNTYQSRPRQRILIKVTRQMIADARGITVSGVRQAAKQGRVDLHDLGSIARYIVK